MTRSTLGSDALRRVALGALALLALNVAIAQANVLRMLVFQSTHRGSDIASMAIYPLIDALKARGVRTVVCMDYGPCQSIYILTAGGRLRRFLRVNPLSALRRSRRFASASW